jgi:hypothetical protein
MFGRHPKPDSILECTGSSFRELPQQWRQPGALNAAIIGPLVLIGQHRTHLVENSMSSGIFVAR